MDSQSGDSSSRLDELGHVTGYSRQGAHRDENQDCFSVDDHVWVVADGMGGHRGGRTASLMAVTAASLFAGDGTGSDFAGVAEICHCMVLRAGLLADQPDMGSTLVRAARDVERGTVQIGWCGDSRAYTFVDGRLRRLTRDHNLAEEELAGGRITAHEAWDHPGQGILTRALGCGAFETPEIELVEADLEGLLLLCTDGLTSGLRDEQIAELLGAGDLTEIARNLVQAAVAAGSTDDTTVVLVDLDREVVSEDDEEVGGAELEHVKAAVGALGAQVEMTRGGVVHFRLDGLPGHAYDKGGQLLRASIFFDDDVSVDEAVRWVERQPHARAGSVEAVVAESRPVARPRLLFERRLPLQEDDAHLIAAEARAFADAWDRGIAMDQAGLPDLGSTRPNVLTQPPANAWLLFGSRPALPTADELKHSHADWKRGLHRDMWTVSKHVEPGDLVFIYFTSPIKEIRYVARVSSHPFYDDDEVAKADGPVAAQQWWAWLTPLQEVEPISLAQLHDIAGERVVGRAHGGRYLRPELANSLVDRITEHLLFTSGSYLNDVLQPVQERDGLADPLLLTLEQWRMLSAGLLRLEADVERHVVEPLLRWALDDLPEARLVRQKQLTNLVPDYVVEVDGDVVLVIEAKQRIRRRPGQDWATVNEAQQLTRYMDARGCAGVLVDAHEVHLFEAGSDAPHLSFSRQHASPSDVQSIASLVSERERVATSAGDMFTVLAAAGIDPPPLGWCAADQVSTFEPWQWGSRQVSPIDMYMFDPKVVQDVVEHGPLFSLRHFGHGANSYGLNLVTGCGPVVAFVQHGFGGAYMDEAECKSAINATYSRLRTLFDKLDGSVQRPRWLVAYSDFRCAPGLIDLDTAGLAGTQYVEQLPAEQFASEAELFDAIEARLDIG